MITSPSAALAGLAAGLVTYFGGTIALRLRERLALILGLAAGVVVGVALFDLLPEAIEIGARRYGAQTIFGAVGLGMVSYMALDRGLAAMPAKYAHARRHLGPASLTLQLI